MPFDTKLACHTNYQERRSFPWPLVLHNFRNAAANTMSCEKVTKENYVSSQTWCPVFRLFYEALHAFPLASMGQKGDPRPWPASD